MEFGIFFCNSVPVWPTLELQLGANHHFLDTMFKHPEYVDRVYDNGYCHRSPNYRDADPHGASKPTYLNKCILTGPDLVTPDERSKEDCDQRHVSCGVLVSAQSTQ